MSAPVFLAYAVLNSAGGLITQSCAAPVPAGTAVIVQTYDGANPTVPTGSSVSDSKGNIYTSLAFVRGTTANVQVFMSTITVALTTSDTISYQSAITGTHFLGIMAQSTPGYTILDATYTNTAGATSQAYSVTGAAAPAMAGEMNLGFANSGGSSFSPNPPTGWTAIPAGENPAIITAYQLNAGSTAIALAGNQVTSSVWAAVIIALKPDANPQPPFIPLGPQMISFPLPWRKRTPLHMTLGARSIRYLYQPNVTKPSAAAPQTVNFRYDASTGMDRIIGFTMSIASGNAAGEFFMQDLNTGCFIDYTMPGTSAIFISGVIETLPDEVNIQFYWSAAQSVLAYVSFQNVDVVPVSLTS